MLVTFVGVAGFELVQSGELPQGSQWLDIQLYQLFVPVLILSAAIMAVRATSRLAAVCALGVIGYAVAMLFVMFGAPDLAMTQLAIETMTVILFVLVIYRLPHFNTLSSTPARVRDAILAVIAGGVMAAVVLVATAAHAPSRLADFFADSSLAKANGTNMVNVILVDFRGFDTLGEITVLAAAALGIYTLMRIRLDSPTSATPTTADADDFPTGSGHTSDRIFDAREASPTSPASDHAAKGSA